MKIGSHEHYGWDDWYAVTVRHVFIDGTGMTTHAWLEGARGPRGEPLSVLVAPRTPPVGWREPGAGQRMDVWAWPIPEVQGEEWRSTLSAGRTPTLTDLGRPQQWLTLVGDGQGAQEHRLERARMFRGLTFRGRTPDQTGVKVGAVEVTGAGLSTSADIRVATRNFDRSHLWCVLGDEGRVVDERPGLAPLQEVFFLPGTRFRVLSAWQEHVGGHLLDVALVHQLDTIRSGDTPPVLAPERVPALVRVLAERALAEPDLRLRDPGRFAGPLT